MPTEFFTKYWIIFAIAGYFLIALSSVISKIMVSGSISKPFNPAVYAFYSGSIGPIIFLFLMIPNAWLGFLKTGIPETSSGIAAGALIILGLWPFFKALSKNETSRVMCVYVGSVPIFTLFVRHAFFAEKLKGFQILAFTLLVAAGILASVNRGGKERLGLRDTALTLLSAACGASGLSLMKYSFELQGFFSAFMWIGVGYTLAMAVIFFYPGQKQMILATGEYATKSNASGFFWEKICGVSGSIIIKYSIFLVGPTMVNAFEGTKQFFVIILSGLLSKFRPDLLKEETVGSIFWQKLAAAILIVAGVFLLIFS